MTDAAAPPMVRLLACGNPLRGDDGVAAGAVALLLPALPPELVTRVDVRCCNELRTEDLLDLPEGMLVLVVDAVAGPASGSMVVLPLHDLARLATGMAPSSHQLPLATVVGLAGELRGSPLEGTFVGLAVECFAPGESLSAAASAALPSLAAAIRGELEALVASDVRMPPAPPG